MARRISEYTPAIPAGDWTHIEGFVRAAVAEAQPNTVYAARDLLISVTGLTYWCWQTACVPVEREVVFDRAQIEEYIASGCPSMRPGSRGNRRSQLFRVAEQLVGTQTATRRLAPLPASDPAAPYVAAEIAMLRSWCAGQPTQRMRNDAAVLVALGAGAGLAVEDLIDVRIGDVTSDDEGVVVTVRGGRRPRTVPVLVEWEALLAGAVDGRDDTDGFAFRPGRTTTHKNAVSNFVAKTTGVGVRPSSQRLRVTWIVRHLAAGTPVAALIGAAGVESLEALTRYVRFVPALDAATVRRRLREGRG